MQHAAPHKARLSADMVQRILDENQQLILAVIENQQTSNMHECAQYLENLKRNLMMLAAVGDVQVNGAGGIRRASTRRAPPCPCHLFSPLCGRGGCPRGLGLRVRRARARTQFARFLSSRVLPARGAATLTSAHAHACGTRVLLRRGAGPMAPEHRFHDVPPQWEPVRGEGAAHPGAGGGMELAGAGRGDAGLDGDGTMHSSHGGGLGNGMSGGFGDSGAIHGRGGAAGGAGRGGGGCVGEMRSGAHMGFGQSSGMEQGNVGGGSGGWGGGGSMGGTSGGGGDAFWSAEEKQVSASLRRAQART